MFDRRFRLPFTHPSGLQPTLQKVLRTRVFSSSVDFCLSRHLTLPVDSCFFVLWCCGVVFSFPLVPFLLQPEMCGNGIRCMARFLADLEGKTEAEYKIHTLAGTIVPVVRPNT